MLEIERSLCLECGGCVPICPVDALFLSFDHIMVDHDLCIMCGICVNFCPVGAIEESDAVKV